ncbi:MAG: hypothetical protein FJ202_01475 [Gemmatimonadetes bacterium]|nr:hypothetical protein [Gemmatimonadota bacterium]
MFEELKATVRDLVNGRIATGDRRAVVAQMKQALVAAKMGIADLRDGVEQTRDRLKHEREQLETVVRRKALAASIPDAETVTIAEKFERQHSERAAVLERKLEAQEAELALAEADYDEMLQGLKAAGAGVGSGLNPSNAPLTDEDLGLRDDSRLNAELGSLSRDQQRSAASAQADAQLEELKRKMGR